MKILSAASLVLLAALTVAAQSSQDGRIKVYVYASKSADGFVDSTRTQDSARDIRDILADKNHKGIYLVEYPEAADILLEVKFSGMMTAGTTTNARIQKGIFGGLTTTSNTETKALPAIQAVLSVRGSEYTKEIGWMQQLFWKDLAKRVVSQFDSWVNSNAAQLLAKKGISPLQ